MRVGGGDTVHIALTNAGDLDDLVLSTQGRCSSRAHSSDPMPNGGGSSLSRYAFADGASASGVECAIPHECVPLP